VLARAVEVGGDDRVDPRDVRLHPPEVELQQLEGADLLAPDESGQVFGGAKRECELWRPLGSGRADVERADGSMRSGERRAGPKAERATAILLGRW
jgi:hypothetical protein